MQMARMTKIKTMGDKEGILPDRAMSPLFQKIIWKRRFDEAFQFGCSIQDLKLISSELERHTN